MVQNLNERAQEMLREAESYMLQENFFFVTTFARYKTQLNILSQLETCIHRKGVIIESGGKIKQNPAVTEYNRTAAAANQTAATLEKIVMDGRMLANIDNQLIGGKPLETLRKNPQTSAEA